MVFQKSKINCRTQVSKFHAHSLTQSIAMIKKSFKNSEKTQKCTKKMPFFHDYTKKTQKMGKKPMYLCSTCNFCSLDTHDNPGGVGIIFCTNTGIFRLPSPRVQKCHHELSRETKCHNKLSKATRNTTTPLIQGSNNNYRNIQEHQEKQFLLEPCEPDFKCYLI